MRDDEKAPEGRVLYPLGYQRWIDGFRGVSVLLIVECHSGWQVLPGAFLGVTSFFVLSGYLITTILVKEFQKTGDISLLSFYRRRAIRLYPALIFACLFFFCSLYFVLDNRQVIVSDVVAAVGYISNWTRAFGLGSPQYLGHTWSLAIEEQFYLIWPLLLLAALRFGRTAAPILALVGFLIVCIIGWRMTLYFDGVDPQRIFNGFDTLADQLLIGCLVSLLVTNFPDGQIFRRILRWMLIPALFTFAGLVVFLPFFSEFNILAGSTLAALCAGLIICALALGEGSLVRSVLGSDLLVFFGRLSYAIYIWHYPVFLLIHQNEPDYWLHSLEATAAFFLFVVPMTALSYRFIERPLLAFKYATPSGRRSLKIISRIGLLSVSFSSICALMVGYVYFFVTEDHALAKVYQRVALREIDRQDILVDPVGDGQALRWNFTSNAVRIPGVGVSGGAADQVYVFDQVRDGTTKVMAALSIASDTRDAVVLVDLIWKNKEAEVARETRVVHFDGATVQALPKDVKIFAQIPAGSDGILIIMRPWRPQDGTMIAGNGRLSWYSPRL